MNDRFGGSIVRSILILAGAAAVLAGCASGPPTEHKELAHAPICDGKHRRPANPFGSVLQGAASPATVTQGPDTSLGVPPVIETVQTPPIGSPPPPAKGKKINPIVPPPVQPAAGAGSGGSAAVATDKVGDLLATLPRKTAAAGRLSFPSC